MSDSSSSSKHQAEAAKLAHERPVRCAVLTVSDTRTLQTDVGGPLIEKFLKQAGHEIAFRAIVRDDDEAITLMNDSPYGLTASIWTRDMDRAAEIGARVETGTVYMNRCDYLDPHLTWTGVKDTGRGAALSKFGFEALTQPKSFHLREI